MNRGFATTMTKWALSWRRSLGLQLLAVLFVVSCTLSALACFYDYRTEEASARNSLLAFGRSLARQAALASPQLVLNFDVPVLEAYVEDLVRTEKYVGFASVRRNDGKVLASRIGDGIVLDDEAVYRVEQPIRVERGGEQIGTFELGISLRPMQQALRDKTVGLLLRSSLGFLLLAALFWAALRGLVLQPLHRLDEAAKRLGSGRLEQPIEGLGSTELGRLAGTMDVMRANLLQSHRSLAQQNEQLVELNRLKSQFLANMSHEMRTPLTSIHGGAEMLLDASANDVDRKETAAAVQRNSQHLLELVDRVLDLAKLETGNLVVDRFSCGPEAVVREACQPWVALAAGKAIELRLDTDGLRGCTVTTDPSRLRQLVAMLVGNAVKFTDRGHVDVRAHLVPHGPGATLQVEVADTGIGIPAAHMPHLFETFRQADGSSTRRHGGLGLGLAIARGIARRLGGDVVVTSEEGRGTRAVLTIAVPDVVPATSAAPAPAAAGPTRSAAHVLVVDDAPDNQRLLRAMLMKGGHTVTLAASGREAVDAVVGAATGRQFDLVVMDLQMPELDGVSAIRLLRERGFDLPIVALTAHAMAEDRERCIAAGADGYETKPITRQRLLEIVALHGKHAAS